MIEGKSITDTLAESLSEEELTVIGKSIFSDLLRIITRDKGEASLMDVLQMEVVGIKLLAGIVKCRLSFVSVDISDELRAKSIEHMIDTLRLAIAHCVPQAAVH